MLSKTFHHCQLHAPNRAIHSLLLFHHFQKINYSYMYIYKRLVNVSLTKIEL